MRFLDLLKDLYNKENYVRWSDIYKQLEDAAANGETSSKRFGKNRRSTVG